MPSYSSRWAIDGCRFVNLDGWRPASATRITCGTLGGDIMHKSKFLFPMLVAFLAIFSGETYAESNTGTVDVKYRGPVSLAPFSCEAVTKSSAIQKVCYDQENSYMLINLNGNWYHHCSIDQKTVSNLLKSESLGQYYNSTIKGYFDCRANSFPRY